MKRERPGLFFQEAIFIYFGFNLFRQCLHPLPQRGEQGGVLRVRTFGVHLLLALGGGLRALEVKPNIVIRGIGVCPRLFVIVSP